MKISEMDPANPLTGSELFEIVQDGQNRKCSVSEIISAAPDANGVYPVSAGKRVQPRLLSTMWG